MRRAATIGSSCFAATACVTWLRPLSRTCVRSCPAAPTSSPPLEFSHLSSDIISEIAERVKVLTQQGAPKDGKDGIPTSILRSIVKIFATTSVPNCVIPWQMRQQITVTGSGFVVDVRRRLIVTNAHVVQAAPFVEVRKHGDSNNHTGFVVFIGVDCDLALVYIPDDGFWAEEELKALSFDTSMSPDAGRAPEATSDVDRRGTLDVLAEKHMAYLPFSGLPALQDSVKVVGYPIGGDQISITSGVVSRIDASTYGSHCYCQLLAVQLDAAINSGNSGGPALSGKTHSVIGIAFQVLTNADSIGYIIPVPIISAFANGFMKSQVGLLLSRAAGSISDSGRAGDVAVAAERPPWPAVSSGTREYFEHLPTFSFTYQVLLNKTFRTYVGLKDNQSGVLITNVAMNSPARGLLVAGDVLLAVNGYTIENDGTIEYRKRERMAFQHVGHVCPADAAATFRVLRNKTEEIEVNITPTSVVALVRQHLYTSEFKEKPKWCMLGGLVFSTLTNTLMTEWGTEWFNTAPRWLVNQFISGTVTEDRTEVVVVVQVIPHPVNKSYDISYGRIVCAVDGTNVKDFEHFKALLKERRDAAVGASDEVMTRLTVNSSHPADCFVVLPVKESMQADAEIGGMYGLPAQTW